MERLAFNGRGVLVSAHPEMMRIFQEIRTVLAHRDLPLLITGESGTGKELLARSVHHYSRRSARPFIALNCGAIPKELVESELFGSVKGAFSGANKDRSGYFGQAEGGTLFLDEIGELPLEAQVKLLRVLQENEYTPLGSAKSLRADVRILSATNRDLGAMVAAGQFREDLYFRIAQVPVELLPLRERAIDIPILANELLLLSRDEEKRNVEVVHQQTIRVFCEYAWPGNIRELQQTIRLALAYHPDGVRRALHHRFFPMNLQKKFGVLPEAKPRMRPEPGTVEKALRQNLAVHGPRSVRSLAQATGFSPSTIKDNLRQLEARGQITVDHRTGRNGNTVRLAEAEDGTCEKGSVGRPG